MPPIPTGLVAVIRGERVDDLQIAWLMIGWLLAFWAGKDLQTRFARRRAHRRGD